jgi:hypothetical protein
MKRAEKTKKTKAPKKTSETGEKKTRVAPEDFVKAWQKSESIAEVAEATGLALGSCSQKATLLRKNKVPLKKFARAGKVTDYGALADLAKSLAK